MALSIQKTSRKEYPILFKPSMVRAILSGTKTQTRRIVKGQPAWLRFNQIPTNSDRGAQWTDEHGKPYRCPYGKPGDVLWVRETHYRKAKFAGKGRHPINIPITAGKAGIYYEGDPWPAVEYPIVIRSVPSIHMNRWASRIDLINMNVRAERVQDISKQDAIAEGIEVLPHGAYRDYSTPGGVTNAAYHSFVTLWDSINAKPRPARSGNVITHYESYPFFGETRIESHRGRPHYIYANPLVFVTEFKMIEAGK